MATTTTHYGWVQPTPGGDPTTWGTELNTDLGLIDAQVWANQQAGVPVGTVVMFASTTPPSGWFNCDGAAISRATYATLFGVVGTNFGAGDGSTTFNLPNFHGRMPGGVGFTTDVAGSTTGYGLGQEYGEFSHILGAAEMPSHTHGVSDPTHGHGVADPTHGHGVVDLGHVHDYNTTFGGGSGIQSGSGYGEHHINTGGNATGINIALAGTGVSIALAGTGISIQNAGGGGGHNNVPPMLGINFIIRAV